MLLPIKCFNCGMVIGNKHEKYLEMKKEKQKDFERDDRHIYKKLRLKRYCCRRMLLSNVEYITKLK